MEPLHGVRQRGPLDETHRVVRFTLFIGAGAENRDDPGMVELARHFRLVKETEPRFGVKRLESVHPLERNGPVQFRVLGEEDMAQSPTGMMAEKPIPPRVPHRQGIFQDSRTRPGADQDSVQGTQCAEQPMECRKQFRRSGTKLGRRDGQAEADSVVPAFQQFGEAVMIGHGIWFI